MKQSVDDEEDIQAYCYTALEFALPEDAPQQEQVEWDVEEQKDDKAGAIVEPREAGENCPLAAADRVHFMSQDEGQGGVEKDGCSHCSVRQDGQMYVWLLGQGFRQEHNIRTGRDHVCHTPLWFQDNVGSTTC